MNVLLLGANGQLGRTFLHNAELAALGNLTVASRDGAMIDGGSCEPADLGDLNQVRTLLDRRKPDVIINTAAYTAVDRAEHEEDTATRVNGDAVALLGEWATRHQALVVNYSTDYVFDGSAKIPYAVNAPTRPLGAYGRSKLAGEVALRESGAAHLLFRTSWVYAAHGHNFVRTMLRLANDRDQLGVVADQLGTPTSTNLIVNATLSAVRKWQLASPAVRGRLQGTHHLAAGGITSWHDFAASMFERAYEFGVLSRKPYVKPISTNEYPTPARRPTYSALDCSEFQELFGIVLPHWTVGLDEVMREIALQGKLK